MLLSHADKLEVDPVVNSVVITDREQHKIAIANTVLDEPRARNMQL